MESWFPLRNFENMVEDGALRTYASSGTEVESKQKGCGWSQVDGEGGIMCCAKYKVV